MPFTDDCINSIAAGAVMKAKLLEDLEIEEARGLLHELLSILRGDDPSKLWMAIELLSFFIEKFNLNDIEFEDELDSEAQAEALSQAVDELIAKGCEDKIEVVDKAHQAVNQAYNWRTDEWYRALRLELIECMSETRYKISLVHRLIDVVRYNHDPLLCEYAAGLCDLVALEFDFSDEDVEHVREHVNVALENMTQGMAMELLLEAVAKCHQQLEA